MFRIATNCTPVFTEAVLLVTRLVGQMPFSHT